MYWIKSNHIENILYVKKCEWLTEQLTDRQQELLELQLKKINRTF